MGLRTTALVAERPIEVIPKLAWNRRLLGLLAAAEAAVESGRPGDLASVFAGVATWGDAQRAYEARRRLAELTLSSIRRARAGAGAELALAVAGALLDALEDAPSEPALLNEVAVLLTELGQLGTAADVFRVAYRLDPSIPGLRENIEAVRAAKRGRPRTLPGPLGARARALGARARRVARLAGPTAGLRLSLCMIVKDEEEMLPGCLEAVRDAVDEIVVVDTGSSDRTAEIARSFGALVLGFPWSGSFADARNYSLEHATGDWILYLDADEHLVLEDAHRLRELLGRTWREGFYLAETNYTGEAETGGAVTHLALRVFRNRPHYRFAGRIHEQKTHVMPMHLSERWEQTTIRVRHFGYLKSRISARDKSRRNVELLEREAAEGGDAFTLFNLGSEYLAVGDPERARRCLDGAWVETRAGEWRTLGYAPILATRVVKARREAGDHAAAREAVAEALSMFPDHTDVVIEAAVNAREEGRLEEAIALAERCLALGDAPTRYAATVGAGTFLALNLLAELHGLQGRLDVAEELHRRSLADYPGYAAPMLPLATLMLARNATPADIEAELPDEGPTSLLLAATACYEGGHAAEAEDWFRRVLERQPGNPVARVGLIEALLSQRRYAEAAASAEREPADSIVRPVVALAELFAHAAAGESDALAAALERAPAAGVTPAELELYTAWASVLAGGETPGSLSAEAASPTEQALEALLRVQEFDAFERLLPLLRATELGEQERHDRLARLYFRLGYLESAADEWIAVVERAPTAPALVGLAQVAVARGLLEDAGELAEKAVRLDPDLVEARRLAEVLRERSRGARVAVLAPS